VKLRIITIVVGLLCLAWIPAFAGPIPTYTGSVVDDTTGEPIENASVLIYWVKSIPEIMHARSELIKADLVKTDKNGNYSLGGFIAFLGLTAWHDYTQVVIYQPGYQAYLNITWEQSPYSDKKQHFKISDNLIRLKRIPSDFDHGKHYKDIDDALRGLDDYSAMQSDGSVSWEGVKSSALKGQPEKLELLQRAYWEEERSLRKYER